MKAKLKKPKPSKAVCIGAPEWDGTVRINDRVFEQGKQYEVSKEEFESGCFTQIKEKKEDE